MIACPNCGGTDIGINTRYVGKDLRRVDVTWVEPRGEYRLVRRPFGDDDEPLEELGRHLFCWSCNQTLPDELHQNIWDEDLNQPFTRGTDG